MIVIARNSIRNNGELVVDTVKKSVDLFGLLLI